MSEGSFLSFQRLQFFFQLADEHILIVKISLQRYVLMCYLRSYDQANVEAQW